MQNSNIEENIPLDVELEENLKQMENLIVILNSVSFLIN